MSSSGAAGDATALPRKGSVVSTAGHVPANAAQNSNAGRVGIGAPPGAAKKSGMDIDEALKRIALEKAQREASEKFLSGHLQSLQNFQDDVMVRWQSPNDFEKIDLVVAELLRNSSITAAYQYMERVQALVEAICNKLLPGAVREGYVPQQHNSSIRRNATGSEGTSPTGTAHPITSANLPNPHMLQTTESKLRTAEADLKAARGRLEQQMAKTASLQNQLTDQRAKVGMMETEMKDYKAKLDKREAELAATASRQAAKAAEMSSALVQVDARKRIEQELRDKLDTCSAELSVSQDSLRKAEKSNAQLRIKNTALEDQIRKDKREEVKETIMAEMAHDQVWELERELKSERQRNLKAIKGKNKEIDSLQTRLRELEKELEQREAAEASAAAEGMMTSRSTGTRGSKGVKGVPYNEKPFYWSFEYPENQGEKPGSTRAGLAKSAKAGRRAPSAVMNGAKSARGNRASKVSGVSGSGAEPKGGEGAHHDEGGADASEAECAS